jgi:membrane-bound inhibitor of C-type lysozyme
MKFVTLLMPLVFLISCHSNNNRSGVADSTARSGAGQTYDSTKPITTVVFDCDSGNLAAIRFWNDRCRLTGMLRRQNLDVTLPQVISGSGARYSDGRMVVWNKGDDVFIDLGNGQTFNCVKKSEVRPE